MSVFDYITTARPPWKHQVQTVDRFADDDEMAAWHDMGTGKTTTTIVWVRWKYACEKRVLKTLIVSPVATLWNWKEEWERNAPPGVAEKVRVLYGAGPKRLKILADPDASIFITNPEIFSMPTVVEALAKMGFEVVALDEAHRFKDYKSKRLKELLRISDKALYRVMLTGTPILNSYLDIWSQFRFLDKGKTFFTNYHTFKRAYFVDKNAGMPSDIYFPKWVPNDNCVGELRGKIDALVSRVEKSACLDLPPLVKTVRTLELSPEQKKVYETMLEHLIVEVESGACVASNALTKTLRLLQILSGYLPLQGEWDAFGEGPTLSIKSNPRLEELETDLESLTPKHKVIVWSNFSASYDDIIKVAAKYGKVAELTGRTKDRAAQIKMFNQDPECRVILSNPQAGGTGVNLTSASYSIWFSRGYSLGDRKQAEARNHRGGSEVHEQIVQIDYVIPGTLDEDVLEALERKEDLGASILNFLRNAKKN